MLKATTKPMAARLMDVYERFYAVYGPQDWWPGDGPFEVIVGAILTQSAAWTNVEMALGKMKGAGCWSLARMLMAFAAHVADNYQGDLDVFLAKPLELLREELLSIHGIGEETADDIMVYAANQPSFVIDTYTRRIMDRIGMAPDSPNPQYADYQAIFHNNLPQEPQLYNEFHALWDRHAKEACAKTPVCEGCCLLDICPMGQGLISDS